MVNQHYDRLEEDRSWMSEYGCVQIIEEKDADEKQRPLWKQLMTAMERGDELVIAKFSNAIRGSRELASFLEFCRVNKESRIPSPIQISIIASVLRTNVSNHPMLSVD